MPQVGDGRIRIAIDELSGAIDEIQDLKVCDDVIKYPSAAVRAPLGIVCLDGQGRRREYTAGPAVGVQALPGNRLLVCHDHVVETSCDSPSGPGRADIGLSPRMRVRARPWRFFQPSTSTCACSTWSPTSFQPWGGCGRSRITTGTCSTKRTAPARSP